MQINPNSRFLQSHSPIHRTIMSKGQGKDKDTLIDSHVPLLQCKRAVEALHAYTLKKEQKAAETELLPGKEQHVWLQVAVKQMHPEKKLKPFKMCAVLALILYPLSFNILHSQPDHSCTPLSIHGPHKYVSSQRTPSVSIKILSNLTGSSLSLGWWEYRS